MDTRVARTPTVKLAGRALDAPVADALVALEVRLSLHTSGTAELRFADPGYALFDATSFKLGAELQVLLPGRSNSLTSVFSGEVCAVGVEHERGAGATPMLLVEARDHSHRLATASTFKAYLNQTPGDVVGEIAGRHGLTAKVVKPGKKQTYLLQTGTDHAFLTQLARDLGHEWFTDGKELHFRPRANAAGPTLRRSDGTLLRFAARYDGINSPTSLEVLGWDPATQKAFVGAGAAVLTGNASDLGSTAPFVAEQYAAGKKAFGRALSVGDLNARSAAEADALAQGLARELVGDGLRVEALALCSPDARAGGLVTIEEVGTKLKGAYYVTEVVHEFGPEQDLLTSIVCGGHHVEQPTWSPTRNGDGAWATRGPVIGVVTNIADPEKQGRVKVKFPSLGPKTDSDWARVAAPGAGAMRGLDARPEVNDEVLVAFERGDVRFPIVLGGLWNAKHAIPRKGLENNGMVTSRLLTSRVGHTVELADGPKGTAAGDAKRHITIATGDGKTRLVLGEDGVTLEAKDGNPLVLKAGKTSLTLTAGGELVLNGKALKVTADNAVSLQAKGAAVAIKGATGVTVDGGTKFEAKGAQAKVEGSGMLTLKGGMVKIN